MNKQELEAYLLQALNMALQISGETSYTNFFDVQVRDEEFLFIPRLPASYIIDNELYQKIYLISNATLYPEFTLLKQAGIHFVPLDTMDIHIKRALFFPWKKGISRRLIINDIDLFIKNVPMNTIPIMENFTIDIGNMTSIGIAGNSGSGKSYMLIYLLHLLKNKSDLIIVDPKFVLPSRWVFIAK